MESSKIIYTEEANCRDCYRCVKSCLVKSIKIENQAASVIESACIYCGRCISICPAGAKKYRDDKYKVMDWINSGEKVIAALAPSILGDLNDISLETFVKSLYLLGFSAVSETAIGADIIAKSTVDYFNSMETGVLIGTCCPTVVNYIKIYYPEYEKYLAPYISPMIAHARLLRGLKDYENAKIVFISPCVSKKKESDFYNDLDSVLSFKELYSIFEIEGIDFSIAQKVQMPENFILGSSDKASLFPVDGGMIETMSKDSKIIDSNYMSFSGLFAVMDICRDLPELDKSGKIFLEMTACTGGCIMGPETVSNASIARKRDSLIRNYTKFKSLPTKEIDYTVNFSLSNLEYHIPYKINCDYTEIELRQMLDSIGKRTKEDELNCAGCGYDNCREFAKAVAEGKAESEMCVSQMRREAQSQASALLAKMPYGVVLVDHNLELINANKKFIDQGGEELRLIADTLGSLVGADLRKLVSYSKYFTSVLNSGEDVREFEVRDGDNLINLSILSIVKNKVLCGIVQRMDDSALFKGLISDRIDAVLRHNAETVQRIAHILGENAAQTETVLRSVVEKK